MAPKAWAKLWACGDGYQNRRNRVRARAFVLRKRQGRWTLRPSTMAGSPSERPGPYAARARTTRRTEKAAVRSGGYRAHERTPLDDPRGPAPVEDGSPRWGRNLRDAPPPRWRATPRSRAGLWADPSAVGGGALGLLALRLGSPPIADHRAEGRGPLPHLGLGGGRGKTVGGGGPFPTETHPRGGGLAASGPAPVRPRPLPPTGISVAPPHLSAPGLPAGPRCRIGAPQSETAEPPRWWVDFRRGATGGDDGARPPPPGAAGNAAGKGRTALQLPKPGNTRKRAGLKLGRAISPIGYRRRSPKHAQARPAFITARPLIPQGRKRSPGVLENGAGTSDLPGYTRAVVQPRTCAASTARRS